MQHLSAGDLSLAVWLPGSPPVAADQTLTVYIEGDGLAWRSVSMQSNDPTPITPVALQLALAQPGGPAAYLARPCQYVDAAASGCPSRYWLGARYGRDVLDALNSALDQLKARFAARHLVLVGFSGGGTLGALLVNERTDVRALVTVAGNLDVAAQIDHHAFSPLRDSFDPAQAATRWPELPQWHIVGERDTVVPPALTRALLARLTPPQAHLINFTEADHTCCWQARWPGLWSELSAEIFRQPLR